MVGHESDLKVKLDDKLGWHHIQQIKSLMKDGAEQSAKPKNMRGNDEFD
jgi:hypothetical protein